jgi:hypothetical protein
MLFLLPTASMKLSDETIHPQRSLLRTFQPTKQTTKKFTEMPDPSQSPRHKKMYNCPHRSLLSLDERVGDRVANATLLVRPGN